MSNVGGSTIQARYVSTIIPPVIRPLETNVIQNLQSAVFVPPQPVPLQPVVIHRVDAPVLPLLPILP